MLSQQKLKKKEMTPEHASFNVFTELLRRREVPGWQRREAERQATFEARYCDTEQTTAVRKWKKTPSKKS